MKLADDSEMTGVIWALSSGLHDIEVGNQRGAGTQVGR
jgi:hypothetical protein